MKKIYTSLLCIFLHTFLLISTSSASDKLKRIDTDTHAAACAALLSIPKPSDETSRRLLKLSIGYMIGAFTSGKTKFTTFPSIDPDHTKFAIECMPAIDDRIPSEEDQDHLLKQAKNTSPTAVFTTKTSLFDSDYIITTYSPARNERIVTIKTTPIEIILNVDPHKKTATKYTIASITVKPQTSTSIAEFARRINITKNAEQLELPTPIFENTPIIAEVRNHPKSSDTSMQIVQMWTDLKYLTA